VISAAVTDAYQLSKDKLKTLKSPETVTEKTFYKSGRDEPSVLTK
jgi:hypothetical protein